MLVSDDLSWSRHCQEICKKAYSRMSMPTKLKYVGVRFEDLIYIYILYIRSLTEYCSVSFHSSLTVEQSNKIERIQKTCQKVILLIMKQPQKLQVQTLCMTGEWTRTGAFSLKSIKQERNQKLFPLNSNLGSISTRHSESLKSTLQPQKLTETAQFLSARDY